MAAGAPKSPQARRDSRPRLSPPAQQPTPLQLETARSSHLSFHHLLQLTHLARLLSNQRLLAKLQPPHLHLSRFFNAAQPPEPQRTAALAVEIEEIRQTMQLVDKAVVAIEGKRSRLEKLITKLEQQRTCSGERDESSFTLKLSLDDATSYGSDDGDGSTADVEGPSEANAELASASKLSLQHSALHSQLSALSTQASQLWYRRAFLQTYSARVEAVSAQDEGALKWLAEKLSKNTADTINRG